MGTAKDFDYAQVEAALTEIGTKIDAILNELQKKIDVVSYRGDAQAEVEAALNRITASLMKIEDPLTKMQKKVQEVKDTYSSREAQLKAALSTAGLGGANPSSGKESNVAQYTV